MAPTSRPDYKLNLDGLPPLNMAQSRSANTSQGTSPSEVPAGSGLRYPLGNALGGNAAQIGTGRTGAGSPSKEFGNSRLFPKRAREIQQQEGLTPQIWGPPTTGSGHSTPLRETIPESPGSDSFPDFDSSNPGSAPSLGAGATRRTRAGTVPSRFPGFGNLNTSSQPSLGKSAMSSNSAQYKSLLDLQSSGGAPSSSGQTALLSRLRAGSMPHRGGLAGTSHPFGNAIFASNWATGRQRAGTLQSIRSSDGPSSPREGPADNDVRTLDYLGLVDSPQTNLDMMLSQQRQNGVTIADLAALNSFNNRNTANRFRSFSVNAKEKYTDGDDIDDQYDQTPQMYSGTTTPTANSATVAYLTSAIRQHNMEIEAFKQLTANRPRARTAGYLDSPTSRLAQNYMPTPSRLDNSMSAEDLELAEQQDINGLANAVQTMQINSAGVYDTGADSHPETPTRSLWLGNIPPSTTVSSLNHLFGQFGAIEFARVLTNKSCGFVNFENVQSAITAKAQFNGMELFPGCGPVRIGFAKEHSASNTPGANGVYPSPSPDPFTSNGRANDNKTSTTANNPHAEKAAAALETPNLLEHREEIHAMVQQFGATQEEQAQIAQSLESAMAYDDFAAEIPPITESTHTRVHDAPRLRDIRKRIDNNTCTPAEIETIAMEMMPEIVELSSDYLGNTVVQKLFEHCSEETKEAMLEQISPHLAEIGTHKNGTWAAQKIIEVANTTKQKQMIADALQPHGVNLFLDQFGNYVMQGCLRFLAPINDFIFTTMLNRLWTVAQGRFGARAVRACLESHHATNNQKRLIAAAIAMHSVQLATNSNGALLLTWFLDTCNFPHRRSVLAPRLIPHLVHLGTHKVAYMTVLKVINQKLEPEARDSMLEALFFDEKVLTDIISDQTSGATFVFKVLTTPFLEENLRPECIEKTRNVLVRARVAATPGYRRLMDEVGLSTRQSGTPVNQDTRAGARTNQMNGGLSNIDTVQNGYGRQGHHHTPSYAAAHDQGISPHLQRTISMDSNGFDVYNGGAGGYTHSPSVSAVGGSPNGQAQYQQAYLAQPGQSSNGSRASSYNLGQNIYSTGSPSGYDPYRTNAATPMMPMQTGYPQHMQAGPAQYQQAGYPSPMMTPNAAAYVPHYGAAPPFMPHQSSYQSTQQYYSPGMQQPQHQQTPQHHAQGSSRRSRR